jgi:acetyl esterase/lipase
MMRTAIMAGMMTMVGVGLVDAQSTTRPATTQPSATTKPDMTPIVSIRSRVRNDVPYVAGGTPQQVLDLYSFNGAKNAPVVIFIHGGEWTKGDKREVSYKPRFFNEAGMIFASVNYRLSGKAGHPAQVNDVAAAVRWLRDHAGEYGGDAHRLVLMGHSAGCHLVTLVGLDPRPLATVGFKPADLKAVVSWSGGAFDLVAKVAEGGMYAGYIRVNFGDDEKVWRDASPMNHVGEAKPMPAFLFVSADGDKPGSKAASEKMVGLVRTAGGTVERLILPGKDHTTANHELGMTGDRSSAALLRFLRKTLGE